MVVLRWVWPVMATGALIAVIGALKALVAAFGRSADRGSPRMDELWHRFEEGDITREEFERERQRRLTRADRERVAHG